jgi:hypothetical protein
MASRPRRKTPSKPTTAPRRTKAGRGGVRRATTKRSGASAEPGTPLVTPTPMDAIAPIVGSAPRIDGVGAPARGRRRGANGA